VNTAAADSVVAQVESSSTVGVALNQDQGKCKRERRKKEGLLRWWSWMIGMPDGRKNCWRSAR
jgi:hypothetical protein